MTLHQTESPGAANSEAFQKPTKSTADFNQSAPECEASPPWLDAFLATVTNDEFLGAVFGTEFSAAHPVVCRIEGDPTDSAVWLPQRWPCDTSGPGLNWYCAPATFRPHHRGGFRAQKQQAEMVYCVMLDDAGSRFPLERLAACPPSWKIETSPGNYQVGYILDQPVSATGGQADRLNKALIAAGLCDPGATGAATRWIRLPVAINGKRKYGPPSPRCRLAQWNPELRYSIEQITQGLGLTLPADGRPSATKDLNRAARARDKVARPEAPEDITGGSGPTASVDWDEVESLLAYLDPNMGRADWLRVLMALHSTGQPEIAYPLALEWSRPGATFDEGDLEDAWESLTIDPDGVTLGTMYAMARDAGWDRPPVNVSGLFGAAEAPGAGAGAGTLPPHPLAQFVIYNTQPTANRWIVPGFIGHGVVIFAGTHGVGKTTTLLPLAMVAAGLHATDDPLAPTHWRHVVYITEDVEQVRRIMAGVMGHSALGLDADMARDRLHIVEARRLPPAYAVQVGATYREQFTRTVEGVEVLPLVVIDTKSAVLALEEENSNSEASAAMAALKQDFAGLPVWVVGHVAKTNMTRTDVEALSLRGGSAFEADANQVLYLVKEGEIRYLLRGKTRFEARWTELQVESHCADVVTINEFGSMESVTLRWGIAKPAAKGRKEAAKQAQEREHWDSVATVQREVLDAVQDAYEMGNPLNREGVKSKVHRKRADVTSAIENLLNEFRLYEVVVPVGERPHPKRTAFLVRLTDAERETLMKTGVAPAAKMEVPQTWSIWPNSSVPGNSAFAPNM